MIYITLTRTGDKVTDYTDFFMYPMDAEVSKDVWSMLTSYAPTEENNHENMFRLQNMLSSLANNGFIPVSDSFFYKP